MKPKQDCDPSRRRFLRDVATTTPALAAVATAPVQAVAAEPATGDAEPSAKGYRLTQHIIDYYKSASV